MEHATPRLSQQAGIDARHGAQRDALSSRKSCVRASLNMIWSSRVTHERPTNSDHAHRSTRCRDNPIKTLEGCESKTRNSWQCLPYAARSFLGASCFAPSSSHGTHLSE